MKLSCPNCSTAFNIKDTSVFSGEKNYVKCCKCYYVWDITQYIKKHQYAGVSGLNSRDTKLGEIHEIKPKIKKNTKTPTQFSKVILYALIILACILFSFGPLLFDYYKDQSINKKISIVQATSNTKNGANLFAVDLKSNLPNTTACITGIQLTLFDHNNNLFKIIYVPHAVHLNFSDQKKIYIQCFLTSDQQEKLSHVNFKVY